jgi:hypothetical protein
MRAIAIAAIVIVPLLGCGEHTPKDAKGKAVSPDEVYRNPVDQKTYVAPGGWKTYNPDVPRMEEPGKKVKCDQIRLLTAQDDIASRTTVEALTEFIKEAERLADQSFDKAGKPFRLLVQLYCRPAGHEVKVAHPGDAPQEMLQHYYDALTVAKKLPVKEGEVSFQLELSVNP